MPATIDDYLPTKLLDVSAADSASMWDDAAKTDPVVDGDDVHVWSGLHDFIQATTTKQPTYRSNYEDGYPGVEFDGGDVLSATDASFGTLAGRIVIGCISSTAAQPQTAGTVISIGSWHRLYVTPTNLTSQSSNNIGNLNISRPANKFVFVARNRDGAHSLDACGYCNGNQQSGTPPTGNNDIDLGGVPDC